MKVLVLWADDRSTNLGVRALAQGAAALAERAWGDVSVDFIGYGPTVAPMRVAHPKSLLREAVTGRHGLKRWLSEYDVALDTRAGDSFADIYGTSRLRSMWALDEFIRWSGVPVVLTPQTYGPFETRQGRVLARRSLRQARLTMSRDTASLTPARELGRADRVLHTTDVVFALPVPEPTVERDVILNVSGLLWQSNPHVDSERYRQVVGSVYRDLRASGRRVSLMAHVLDSPVADNDVPAVREFGQLVGDDPELIIPQSLEDVRAAVAGARLVIGSRMHACLNAISVGTPAIALAYSRKFAPLLADLGWSATVDLRADDDAATAVVRLVGEVDRDAVTPIRSRAEAKIAEAVKRLRTVA